MQATYDTFVEKAAQGRNTTPERIDAIGQGRVWTGRQAKQIGLVDELGGLDRARRARQAAREDRRRTAEVELVVYPPTEVVLRHACANPFGGSEQRRRRSASLLGFRDPRVVQALTAPLQRLPPRRAAGAHAECVRAVVAQLSAPQAPDQIRDG